MCGPLLSNSSPHPHPSGLDDEEKEPLPTCQGNKWSCRSANRSPFLPTWKRENRTATPGSTIGVACMGGSTESNSFPPSYTRKIEEQTMNSPFTCLRQEDSPCLSPAHLVRDPKLIPKLSVAVEGSEGPQPCTVKSGGLSFLSSLECSQGDALTRGGWEGSGLSVKGNVIIVP